MSCDVRAQSKVCFQMPHRLGNKRAAMCGSLFQRGAPKCGDLRGDVCLCCDPSWELAGSDGTTLRGDPSWDGGATFSGEDTHAPMSASNARVLHTHPTWAVGGANPSKQGGGVP